jgi:hypothetical protein
VIFLERLPLQIVIVLVELLVIRIRILVKLAHRLLHQLVDDVVVAVLAGDVGSANSEAASSNVEGLLISVVPNTTL